MTQYYLLQLRFKLSVQQKSMENVPLYTNVHENLQTQRNALWHKFE